ncbi:MAG: prepilin-type N-terminal cleavage/methylation domain-containing protein [Clostridia bacterium]|nr:prepilin-type N-terminal cleavage/methylation domain-containing protein [Clostridia bacterium]
MIKSNNKGFTYIELVLAMAIIAFIVLAFSQLFLRTTISVKSMEFQTLAYNFAGDKMEDIKNNVAFAGIGGPQWYPNIWQSDPPQIMAGTTFTRNVRVSALASSLKRVDIEVIWTEGGGNKSIEISTLIAEKW